jgi:predicted O-methyltransferase YrrM
MHPYAARILQSGSMETPDGSVVEINSQISREEGMFLQRLAEEIKPDVSLEIGVAFGISSLFICEVLARIGAAKHIAIDLGPIQKRGSETLDRFGLGLFNLERCGYAHFVEPYAMPSEIALPDLLRHGQRIQFAFIDGWHSFDHALVDFFYVNKMLDVGGVVVFHDAAHPNIRKLVRHVLTYPAYFFYGAAEKPKAVFSSKRKGLEKTIAYALFGLRQLYPDKPNCVALKKIAEDQREWTWFKDF